MLLVTFFICLISTVLASEAWDLGCYSDKRNSREFNISAGNYEINDTTVQDCTSACAHGNRYKYAATEGSYCYCSKTMDRVIKVNGDKCTNVCTGGDACSGDVYLRVFNTSVSIGGLALEFPSVAYLLQDVPISAYVTKGMINASYTFDYGDKSYVLSTCCNTTHKYKKTGRFQIRVSAKNRQSGPIHAKAWISIESTLGLVRMTCPSSIIQSGNKTAVTVSTSQGSHLQGKWITKYQKTNYFNMSEALMMEIGSKASFGNISGSPQSDGAYIKSNDMFKRAGWVMAWEVYAAKTGPIRLQVFRPVCNGVQVFCPSTHTCIPAGSSCQSVFDFKCPGDGVLSLYTGKCLQGYSINTTAYPASSLPLVSYLLTADVIVNISKIGYNLFTMTPSKSIAVEPGDVIGWSTNSSAGDLAFENSDYPEFFYPSTSFNIVVNSTLQNNASATRYNISHVIRVHMSQPSMASHDFSFAEGGIHNVSIVVENEPMKGEELDVCSVYVQDKITGLQIETPLCYDTQVAYAAGEPIYLNASIEKGTSVSYTWDFNSKLFRGRAVTAYKYTVGLYNLILAASNNISASSVSTIFSVLNPVGNISFVSSQFMEVDQTSNFSVAVSQGTNVTLVVDFNSERVKTILIPEANDTHHRFSYVFQYGGQKIVRIKASNNIKGATQVKTVGIYVTGKLGEITTDVQPQVTCDGALEISTGEGYEIFVYSSLDIPINYTMYDGVSAPITRTTLTGKATFSGKYNQDFTGNISINASADGDIVRKYIPVRASRCGTYSILKPVAYKRENPLIITKANELVIMYKHRLKEKPGCVYGNLFYTWKIFDIDSGSPVEVPNFTPIFGYNDPIFKVGPLTLQEGNYTVNLSLIYKGNKQLCYNYETFVDVRQSSLFCAIIGGDELGVAYHKGARIKLDGSRSVDPDQPQDTKKLAYQWRCERQRDNSTNKVFTNPRAQRTQLFCNSTTFTELPEGATDKLVQLPIEHFLEGATYVFVLTVRHKDDPRYSTCHQIIKILPASKPSMSIECESNCKAKVNPFDRLIVKGSCSNCDNMTTDLEYEWVIYDNNMKTYILSTNSSVTSTGFNQKSLVISENIFKERSKYTIKLKATRRAQNVDVKYSFITTSRPRDGNCEVIPDKGYTVQDTFKITCDKWLTEDPKIKYKFFYESFVEEEAKITSLPDQSSSAMRLWYFGGDRESPSMSLPIGNEKEDFRLPLFVKISNFFDAFTVFHLNVTVQPLSLTATKKSVDEISNQLKTGEASNLNPKENPQQVLGYVTTTSNLLNSAHAKSEVSKEKIKGIRSLMVQKVSQIEATSLPLITEQCHAFAAVIENENEVTNEAQLTTSDTLKKSSKLLLSKAKERGYEKKSPRQIEEVAQAVLSAVSKTFKASEATTQDFLDQALENLQKKGASKSRNWSVRIRHRDGEDSAKAAESVVSDLTSVINLASTAIQENKVEGENETSVKTKTFGLQLRKSTLNNIQDENLQIYGSNGGQIGSFLLPKRNDFLSGVYSRDKTLRLQMSQFGENPVRWDEQNSAFINSSIIGLELIDDQDNEIPVRETIEPVVIWLPVTIPNVVEVNETFDSTTFLTYHYRVQNPEAYLEPLLIHVKPSNELTMYVRFDDYPNTTHYDLTLVLPNVNKRLPRPFTYIDEYTILVHDLTRYRQQVYLGLKSTELVPLQVLKKPGNSGFFEVRQILQIKYTMDIRSVGCKHWSVSEPDAWRGSGCKVGVNTTYKSVQCLCNHLTFFGSLSIKPNPIPPPTWEDFKKGFVGLVAVCVIFTLYFIALIWARRKDKADIIKIGACPLSDNDPTDQYRYEVTLWTSMRRSAGTTSKVNIILCGEENDSEPRALEDPERKPFQRGSVDTFLLTTPYILGSLPYIRIWHDNSGGSWFLSRVMIVDLQTDDHHYFICNRWLAVDEDDGQVERLIPLASKEELTEFQHLFVARTRRNLSDSHLWFSVFARPASSRFTRVQRLTCCLCLLMMSMMTSAMYYGVAQKDTANQNFGGVVFTWSEVFIGIISSLIVFPVNLIVVQIFRSVRPKPHRITHRKLPMPPKLPLTVNNLSNYNRMKDSSDDSNKGSNNSLDSTHEKNNARMRLSINDVHTDVDRISFTSSPLLVDSRRRSTMWETQASTGVGRLIQWFKRHSSLPYYFIYVAWVSSFILTIGAAAVIVVYGIGFGNDKSLKWLFASSVSFVQDVIITQPLKVLGTAIFFALVVKKPDKGEFEVSSDTAQLAEDEDWLYNYPCDSKTKKKKRKTKLLPPDEAKLLAMRNTRLKERKMYSVIREVGSFYIFLCLVMMIAYTHKDFYSFVQTDVVKKMFVNDFLEIKKDLDFWAWARKHLMTNLFPSEWYNGQRIEANGFLSDGCSQMVGGARLRHIRIKDEVCSLPPSTTFIHRECFGQYAMSDEQKQDYLVSWINVTKYSKPVSRKDVSWRYQSWTQLDGYPVWALLNTYSGGGYVLVLEPGMKNVENLKKLEKQFWIDRHTRAVITEFTIYNAQTNLFTIATLVAEFPATGGVIPFVLIQTARLYNYTKEYMFFVLACECLFVLFILFFLYRELRKLFREGTPHFKQFWNICEIVILVSAGVGIGLYVYRWLNFTNVLDKTRNAPFQFKSFQIAAYWDEMYTLCLAILVTFSTIKLNKLLRFNRRMSLLSSTLKNAAFSLAMFGLIFGILFLAFSLIGTVVFGTQINEYRNSASSFTSLLSLMLGKTSFLELDEAHRILGPMFFFAFMFLVSMVLINMFLSIIIDSYHEVKRDLEKQSNEYEIVDFIIERFKLWSGIGKVPVKPQFQHRNVKWGAVQAKVKTVYAFKHSQEDHVTDLEDRLEKLIDRTNLLYTEVFPEKFRKARKRMSYSSDTKPDHRL